MSEWIKVEDELPEILSETHASEDVLVYCLSLEKTSFEKGEKYFAIDCMMESLHHLGLTNFIMPKSFIGKNLLLLKINDDSKRLAKLPINESVSFRINVAEFFMSCISMWIFF